jgi:hypothetical protein
VGRWSQYRRRGRSEDAAALQLLSAELISTAGGDPGTLRLTFNQPLGAGNDTGFDFSAIGAFGSWALVGSTAWLAGVSVVELEAQQQDATPAVPEILAGVTSLSTRFFSQSIGQACRDVFDFPCPQS